MKTSSFGLALVGILLVGCAGEKNQADTDGAVLAVRTVESGEATEVALISGQFETPQAAQAAAEGATWIPISRFSQDDELAFVDLQNGDRGQVNHGGQFTPNDRGRGHDRERRFRGDRHHDWRPHHTNHHWNRPNWHRPSRPVWDYQRCHYQYIWWNGRCVVPYSAYFQYTWRPRYGYVYRPVHHGFAQWQGSNWYVRFYF